MSIIKPRRSGGVIGTIGPIGGSGVFSLQERHALSVDNFDDVSLYLKMNGANGSTSFLDSSQYGHTVTANGNAQISTAESKFGGASGAFDGNGDLLSIANNELFNLTAGDFTIELFAYWSGSNANATLINKDGLVGVANPQYNISLNGSSKLIAYIGASGLQSFTSSTNFPTNEWVHVALVRNGTQLSMYQSGVNVASGTQTVTMTNATRDLKIGYQANANSTYYWHGYIDDLRITKGVARYTGSFTPPQREFLP